MIPRFSTHCALIRELGASTKPLPVDRGERPLCAPVHTLAKRRPALPPSCRALHDDHSNGGVRCRRLSSSTCQEILEISAKTNRRVLSRSFDISLSATHPDNPGHKNQSNVRSKLAAEVSDSKGIAHRHSVRGGRLD